MKLGITFQFKFVFLTAILISSPMSAPANSNTPSPVISPTVSVAVALSPSPAPEPLKDEEKKKLSSEFQKALTAQKNAHSHQEKAFMKEFNFNQSNKIKKWREDQRKTRQTYFDQHMSGPERRAYVQKYLKDKEQFDASIKKEYVDAKKMWVEKTNTLKATQKELESKFNSSLGQGQRPSADLWPVEH